MNSLVRLAIVVTLIAAGTACPEDTTCTNDLECAVGEQCNADGLCEAADPNEPEGPEPVLPDTTLDAAPDALSNNNTPSFAFSCDRSTCSFECSLDDAPFDNCRSPVEPGELDDGDHTFAVRAITGALVDATPAEVDFVIDTQAPALAITDAPLPLTTETSATFTFTCDADCSLTCALDGEAAQPCTSPFERSGLQDGDHTLVVVATDSATNATSVDSNWTVDTQPPAVILNAPGPGVVGPSVNITFTSADAVSFACALDDAPLAACVSPLELDNLAEGIHSIAVTATDEAGNTSTPESATFDVDATAPSVVVNTAPVSPSTRVEETLFFECSELGCAFECSLDSAPFAGCASPLVLSDLAIGERSLAIRAIDAVGNVGTPVTLEWTIERIFIASSHNAGSFCGVANDRTLWCWGNGPAIGFQENLEDPPVTVENPTQIGTARDWAAVDMNLHTCALSTAGTLACFGTNAGGPHGLGDTSYRALPEPISALTNVTSFTASFLRTCAVADGGAYCWGANNFGNVLGLGPDFDGNTLVPNLVVGGANLSEASLFATNDHMFAIRASGALFRWGGPSGGPVTFDVPTLVDAGPYANGSGGTFSACYRKDDDGYYCAQNNTAEVFVDSDDDWLAMAAANDHSCGIRLDRSVQCWDTDGFAGRTDRGLTGVLTLESFDGLMCALDASGDLHCWGTPTGPITTTSAPQTPAAD